MKYSIPLGLVVAIFLASGCSGESVGERSIRIDPIADSLNAAAVETIGRCEAGQGDADDLRRAYSDLRRAVAIDSLQPAYWVNAARVLTLLDDTTRSLAFGTPPMVPSGVGRELERLHVNEPIYGYFYAASPINDRRAVGGHGKSINYSRPIGHSVLNPGLSLIALPTVDAVFNDRYRGFKVILANTTQRTVALNASDSRLDIVLEALSTDGGWRPVEHLPQSWCGNSYHRLFLPRGHAWTFVAPHYEGDFATRLRFVLKRDNPLYSNEFDGRINLGQFGPPREYQPQGIMDPYQ
jgi:hypothetical protein